MKVEWYFMSIVDLFKLMILVYFSMFYICIILKIHITATDKKKKITFFNRSKIALNYIFTLMIFPFYILLKRFVSKKIIGISICRMYFYIFSLEQSLFDVLIDEVKHTEINYSELFFHELNMKF